jgi:hypothetical protein
VASLIEIGPQETGIDQIKVRLDRPYTVSFQRGDLHSKSDLKPFSARSKASKKTVTRQPKKA